MVRRPENATPNALLRAARERLKIKPAAIARALQSYAHDNGDLSFTCSEDKYRSWEMGRVPRAEVWPVLCGYFGKRPEQLGLRPEPARPYTPTPRRFTVKVAPRVILTEESETRRREFIASTLAATAPAGPMPARVEVRHVRELTDAVTTLRRADQFQGSEALLPAARSLLRHGRDLIAVGAYTDSVGRRLHSAVGWIGVQAGWLSFDAKQMDQAAAYYKDALVAASVSRDDAVAVHALADLAYHAAECQRPREAVSYLRAAQDTADRWAPPALRALLLSREAAQWARLGDLTAFQRLSSEAHDVYEPPPADAWYAFVDEGELYAMEGHGLAVGQRPADAVRLFANAVQDTTPERRRNAVGRTLLLARARAAAGDASGAAEQAAPVLEAIGQLGSARLRGSLRRLRTALAPHAGMSAVKDFEDKARAYA